MFWLVLSLIVLAVPMAFLAEWAFRRPGESRLTFHIPDADVSYGPPDGDYRLEIR